MLLVHDFFGAKGAGADDRSDVDAVRVPGRQRRRVAGIVAVAAAKTGHTAIAKGQRDGRARNGLAKNPFRPGQTGIDGDGHAGAVAQPAGIGDRHGGIVSARQGIDGREAAVRRGAACCCRRPTAIGSC